MPYIVLDIETLQQQPEPFMVPAAETLAPPANYKSPETIAKWRAERAAELPRELWERSALDPLLGGVVCVVGVWRSGQPAPITLTAPTGNETGERALLQSLQQALDRYPDHTLVTWNGAAFDLPYLRKRAARYGLWSLARRCHQSKPWNTPRHIDLRLCWGGADKAPGGKLRQVARFFGAQVSDDVDGANVTSLWLADRIKEIEAHCLSDVRLTAYLYQVFDAAGWAELPADGLEIEITPRPPRLDLTQQRIAVEMDAAQQDCKRAAADVGLEWHQAPEGQEYPLVTSDTPAEQIRAYIDRLIAIRAERGDDVSDRVRQ